ncbi:MAG: GxxExxY protein [Spartobacteria bacterium]
MEIQNQDMLFKEESYEIVGACFEVHNQLGSGFTEPSYPEALEIELSSRGIPFKSQVELPIFYKDTKLKHGFRADFLCHESIIVEIKAVSALLPEHRAQVHNYLNAGRHQLGILVNFAAFPRLQYERIAFTRAKATQSVNFSLREG